MTIRVQGYALPWNSPAEADGLTETVALNAVAPNTIRNITLIAGDHETEGRRVFAQTKAGSLRLRADAYGLAFSATLDDTNAGHALAWSIARGEMAECSVNFTAMHRTEAGRIIWGAIDHIALVTEGAYAATSCWLADTPWRDMAPKQRECAALFGESLRAHLRITGPGDAIKPGLVSARAAVSTRPPRHHSVPASVIAFLASPMVAAYRLSEADSALLRR